MALNDTTMAAATAIAAKIDADVYFYNGPIERGRDLKCIEGIFANKRKSTAVFLPVTNGGSPDAAYKITRYFQDHYESFTVLVSGLCKSAGTLIALGANEIAFTPFGELGPLDIQLSKVDKFDSMQSGLAIQEALDTLENRARATFYQIVKDYFDANNGLMSFATAAKAASDFVTQLYAPVFSRIDPEDVGVRSRSMRIALDYGKRLAVKGQNLKIDALNNLVEKYSSHSFVIDQRETEGLFKKVRVATEIEKDLVISLGNYARFECPPSHDIGFQCLSAPPKAAPDVPTVKKETTHDATAKQRRGTAKNGRDTARANGAAKPKPPIVAGKHRGAHSISKSNGRARP